MPQSHKPGDFLPARGAVRGLPLILEVERELTAEDIVSLAVEGARPVAPPALQQIRAVHHAAARFCAQGLSDVEVALRVGRTPQRIRDLKLDPAFKNLVSVYAASVEDKAFEDGERLRGKLVDAAEIAIDEITERLESPAQRSRIPVGELRQIATMGLDRTVAPPKTAVPATSVPQNITFNIGTKDLRPGDDTKLIEQEPETQS